MVYLHRSQCLSLFFPVNCCFNINRLVDKCCFKQHFMFVTAYWYLQTALNKGLFMLFRVDLSTPADDIKTQTQFISSAEAEILNASQACGYNAAALTSHHFESFLLFSLGLSRLDATLGLDF